MESNQNVKALLEVTLNVEMRIRSITTKVQRVREAQAEYEFYKKMLNEQMIENHHNENKNIQLTDDDVKKEEALGGVVSCLEYLMLLKYGKINSEIEEEIESLKELVDKVPSKIDKLIILNKNI